MSSQVHSPSTSFPASFFRNFDANAHSQNSEEKNNKISDKQNKRLESLNKIQNQSLNDSYTPSTLIDSKTAIQSLDTSHSRSAELEITTKQGDVVKISLNQLATSSRTAFQIEQGNSKISGYEESLSFESNFEIRIEGDLNKNEQKSLKNLLNQLYKVSDEFFNGKIANAFEHAQKVGFDSDQLTGFSLDLNSEQKVQAIAAYQQTTLSDQNINTNLLKNASAFIAQTKDFLADSKATLDFYAEPKQALSDLFSLVGQLLTKESEELNKQDSFLKFIENINKDLVY